MKKKINFNTLCSFLIVFLLGMLLGIGTNYLLITKNTNKKVISKEVKKTTVGDEKFKPLYETYDTLKSKYYKDLDDEKLINGAVNGMMESLNDEHSNFFDKKDKKVFEDELAGSYYGIGAEIMQLKDKNIAINRVFDSSPAKKAGLKAGDIFVSIDGEEVKGMKVDKVAEKLKSDKKDEATIVIKRDNKEKTFKVKKDKVDLLSVSSEMLDNNIGYIAVSIFGEKTYDQFNSALNNLEKKNMKSLIIDLRGNGGGYLDTVTNMLSEFVDSNTVIYQMKTRDGITKYTASNNNTKNYKVIILVDENSASASEIMASAMQEEYGAILVGRTTYGKGTVQETKELSNGTLIKYTVQEWLTSKGESINKKGVKPDYDVKLSDEFKKNPTRENDNQFQKALELAK